MKVMCINTSEIHGFNLTNDGYLLSLIKEGKLYEVESFVPTPNGFGKYYLVGVKNHTDGFSTLRFIPLSDIDETELIKERQTETV